MSAVFGVLTGALSSSLSATEGGALDPAKSPFALTAVESELDAMEGGGLPIGPITDPSFVVTKVPFPCVISTEPATTGVLVLSEITDAVGVVVFAVVGVAVLAGVAALAGVADFTGVTDFAGVAALAGVADFAGVTDFAGVAVLAGVTDFAGVSRFAGVFPPRDEAADKTAGVVALEGGVAVLGVVLTLGLRDPPSFWGETLDKFDITKKCVSI